MNVLFKSHQQDFDVQNKGLMFENQLFTGVLHRSTNNQFGEAICSYKDGKKDGVFKEWYLNGNIKEVSLFQGDEFHGRRICYWPNGTKRFHVNYVNGEMDGVYEEFDMNGLTKQIKTYYKGKLICVKKSLTSVA